jgi:hypothetical protein
MPAGLRHVALAATAALLIALAAPAAALAGGGGNCSACQVYHEPNPPSPGKQQAPPPTPQQPTSSPQPSAPQTQAPKGLSRVLAQAGADKAPLSRLLGEGTGGLKNGSGSVASPGLLGAALDLGAGPTALLAILLATALALAARGSFRGWRVRRRPPNP